MMTLPANDALTLGLTGNHNHDSPSNRSSYPQLSSLRSTSPKTKIPFVNKQSSRQTPVSPRTTRSTRSTLSSAISTQTLDTPVDNTNIPVSSYNLRPRKRPASGRSMSNGSAEVVSATSVSNGHGLVHVNGNGKLNGDAKGVVLTKQERDIRRSEKAPAKIKAPVDWEIPRKTLHSSIGFLTLYLYTSHGSARTVVVVLSAALLVIVPADLLRLNVPKFERVYEKCLGFLMRESEKKATNGVIWYIIGVIFVLSVYPLDLAVVSILILSWADTAASTIGRLWGSLTPPLPRRLLGLPLAPRKSLAGFLAGSLTGALIIAGFWGLVSPLGADRPIWTLTNGPLDAVADEATGVLKLLTGWTGLGLVSLAGGLISGVAEALDLGDVDDNLTLPIISGGCIWGLFKLLALASSYFS